MSIEDEVAKLVGNRSAKHKRLVEYVVRQVGTGRHLASVMDDPYLTNRVNVLERRALLEEPEVVEAVSDDVLGELRAKLERLAEAGSG